MTRHDVLKQAIDYCLKELYSLAQPSVEWDDFIKQNKEYLEKEKEYNKLKDKPDFFGYLGPKPFEFYYLPKEIFKDVVDSYIYAYKIDDHQNFLNIIKILKDYCNEPIVDKYIDDYTDEHGNHHPGYRSYDHPDNLEKEIQSLIKRENEEINEVELASECVDKFFKFLDMAGNFFEWNRDLNTFNMNVYLGASPNSNKQAVIDNWKKYRNKDIEIDEEQIKREYYGED